MWHHKNSYACYFIVCPHGVALYGPIFSSFNYYSVQSSVLAKFLFIL